jgi:hypothetical protein
MAENEIPEPPGGDVARGLAVLSQSELLRLITTAAIELAYRDGNTAPAFWLQALANTVNQIDVGSLFQYLEHETGGVDRPIASPSDAVVDDLRRFGIEQEEEYEDD